MFPRVNRQNIFWIEDWARYTTDGCPMEYANLSHRLEKAHTFHPYLNLVNFLTGGCFYSP